MNILQIVSSSRVSGAERHVLLLSERLRQRGHHVTALCPPGGWLPNQLRESGIPCLEMPMHGLQFLPGIQRVARFAHEHQIDLIHSHLTCATYNSVFAGMMTHLPVVSSVHVQTHDLVYRWLLPKRRNRIITVSDFVRQGLVRYGVPEECVKTIYNGTNICPENDSQLPNFKAEDSAEILPVKAELSLPPDAELIGIFGHVGEFKGHYLLAEALPRLIKHCPSAYIVCVGSVEAETQRQLWELAAASGAAERMRFTGVRNDVSRLLAAMDVIALPSRYEACSMAIIEAMAMGKPVVATHAGGNPELVHHEETGLLIDRTPEALADALVSILSHPERRSAMGIAGRRRAMNCFSASVMTENIENLYRELVSERAA